MPKAQFSVRTSDWKYIQQRIKHWFINCLPTQRRAKIKQSSDSTVQKTKEYNALIDANPLCKKVQSHQPNRHISDEECSKQKPWATQHAIKDKYL